MCGGPCTGGMITFLLEERRRVFNFVNKMQIQVLMTAVDEGGRKGLRCWNFGEILF